MLIQIAHFSNLWKYLISKYQKKGSRPFSLEPFECQIAYCSLPMRIMAITSPKKVNPSISAAAMIMFVPIEPLASG